jgi:Cu/Ag efflux protein CusF
MEVVMKSLLANVLAFSVLAVVVSLCLGQSTPAKKSYIFHGKVVSLNKSTKTLTIDGEKVPGWMEAMTMSYKVDDPSIVDRLKPGDLITATVYDGDYVLHNVKVSGSAKDAKSKE